MKQSTLNTYSIGWSIALHGVMLIACVLLTLYPIHRKRKPPEIVEFTVVLPEQLEPEPDPTPTPTPEPPPEEPDDQPPPEPEKPDDLPPPPPEEKEAITPKKDPPKKPPEKKPPPKKPPEKKPPEKKPPEKKPPEKKPFQKGKRIEPPKQPEKPKQDFTKLKPAVRQPVQRKSAATEKPLSREEILKALQAGARPGTHNSLPNDELSRCVSLVRNALYDAWEQPALGDAGPRPAHLEIRLDSSGRIVSYRIIQTSGSVLFDQTVLRAAARTLPIRGLSSAFLKQYETLTVEFKLQ
ncbi:MAG: TonB C-terminal domain-containing protein [Kiritimatiellae bacterium]|nr:TonB C-terminal domain-containing protein [Kiritimatiellia bacterium]